MVPYSLTELEILLEMNFKVIYDHHKAQNEQRQTFFLLQSARQTPLKYDLIAPYSKICAISLKPLR